VAGAVAGVLARAGDAGGDVTAAVAEAGTVAPAPLAADDVPEVHTMLVTRTPTPSAAPASSVTRGVLSFILSHTQAERRGGEPS